jgi:cyclopropane fatty-acyl-phospholipid synthase-like methyltransferase
MVLGAGLGGPARVLAHEFGAWVTGYEASEELAKAGMELSTMAGMAKKAPILHYDPEHAEPFDRNFDRAFAKDNLFTVENKIDLMRKVSSKLKEDSLFLITDYVLSSDAVRSKPSYETWKAQEPHPPFAITHDQETDLFEHAGFAIRVNEDISEHYVSLISKSWANIDSAVTNLLKQGEEGKTMIESLLHEAEFWSLRCKMMEEGDLQMVRILASKKTTKTLSNW